MERSDEAVLSTLKEMRILRGVQSLLDWDERVYMPPRGAEGRAEQLSALATMIHHRQTDPVFLERLWAMREGAEPDSDAAVIAREAIVEADRAVKVPSKLVAEMAAAESRTHQSWLGARAAKNFALVEKDLAGLFALKMQYAECIRGSRPVYDALLDLYEPGLTAVKADELFLNLGQVLRGLADRIEQKRFEAPKFAEDAFPKDKQFQFCADVARRIGFSFEAGRFDETVHPFCTDIGPGDIRLTTKFSGSDLRTALYGTIHETGHGLYDQGLPVSHYYDPLGESRSLGIHESQSLIWEKFIGRSREFCSFLFPFAQRSFAPALDCMREGDFYRYVNEVKRGFIRIEADEVTYGLHILVRFELEKALTSGNLKTADLRDAWNEQYRELLGLDPEHDKVGVLQDIHWYSGSFGYFPTYLFGAIAAAQLGSTLRRTNPSYFEELASGKTDQILSWLRSNIHQHGKRFSSLELIKRASGEELSNRAYLNHLTSKFNEVYEL